MIRRTPVRGRRMRVSEALTGDRPRRPPPRVSRATQRKRDILALDALWRQLIYLRDGKTCQMPLCGKQGKGIQAHHIFTKHGKFLTRWDEDNGICLCRAHHIWGAHQHPTRFTEFVKKRLGPERYTRLWVRHNTSAKGQDLAAIRVWLKERFKEMEARRVAEG